LKFLECSLCVCHIKTSTWACLWCHPTRYCLFCDNQWR